MTREEIRRRALRAAVAVSLTVGLVGCATTVEIGPGQGDGTGGGGGSGGGSGEGGSGGASATTATSTGTSTVLADAGVDPTDATTSTGTGTDAQANCFQASDWQACCEELNWAPDAGCTPWGPPMPPAMEVA